MPSIKFPRPTVADPDTGCIYAVIQVGTPKERVKNSGNRTAITWDGELWFAARVSYCLNVSEIPRRPPSLKEGLVLHKCDNKHCINPDHLYLGTSSDNSRDNIERNSEYLANLSLGVRRAYEDPEYRARKNAAVKRAKQAPEARARQSAAMKSFWKDPETRKKQSEVSRRNWEDPEYRARQVEAGRRNWEDPEYRARVLEGHKRSWEDPEIRKKRIEAMQRGRARRKARLAEGRKGIEG